MVWCSPLSDEFRLQRHNITWLKLYISPQVLSRPRRVSDAGQLGQVPGGVLRQLLPGRLPLVRGQGRPHRLWWVLHRSDLAQSVEYRTCNLKLRGSSRTGSGELNLWHCDWFCCPSRLNYMRERSVDCWVQRLLLGKPGTLVSELTTVIY